MKRIKVNPEYPVDTSKLDPDDLYFLTLYFLIDDSNALATDGITVELYKVVPDEGDAGAYRVMENSVHVAVAIDDERMVVGLERIVDRLKAMSAFELLTKHYSENPITQQYTALINRNPSYFLSFDEGEDHLPVNEHNPKDGQDY